MKKLVFRAAVNSLAFYVESLFLPEIKLNGLLAAVGAGTLLTFLNISIRPLLIIITSPINILTFGLLTLVVNALMVMLTASIIPGLYIPGFWVSFLAAVVILLINLPFRQLYKSHIVDDEKWR